jgi:hypothetical protein
MLTNVPDHELTLSPNKKSSKRIGGPAAPPYGERRSRYSPNDKKLSDGWSVARPLPVGSAGWSQRT